VGGNEAARSRIPQLRLDELQARIDAARGTRDRVHNLLEAVLSVGRELDLVQVLRRIVERPGRSARAAASSPGPVRSPSRCPARPAATARCR
jgi:hypothetical protein